MIPYPIARKQNTDIQQFYSNGTWNKPVGVSHVYMLLIGAGGSGVDSPSPQGGGSGAVAVWYGAAQNIPDMLYVLAPPPDGSTSTKVQYQGTSATRTTLIAANCGTSGGIAGSATGALQVPIAASGFYQSTAGQAGSGTTQNPSATTFLSGGGSGTPNTGQTVTANYGYVTQGNGYFQLQPVIMGVSGMGLNGDSRIGGIGCGGSAVGGTNYSYSGRGFVLIASW